LLSFASIANELEAGSSLDCMTGRPADVPRSGDRLHAASTTIW